MADPKDFMANERTFLAWIRTSIGIMAFGFVVEKFAFFLKRLTIYFSNQQPVTQASQSESTYFGILLVAMGAVLAVFSYFEYKKATKQIELGTYQPTSVLPLSTTLLVLTIGIFLVIYLINT